MITRVEAEAIAARWARGEADQRGYGCEPAIAEFDLGYVIWTRPAPDVLPIPGDGARTVIDRETGALSTWPGIPPDEIAARYRDHRPRPSRTVDPAVALRRAATRRPTPTIAAELVTADRVFRAQGAKGDQQITHHPQVAERLAAIPPAARVRGAERHAELLAASEVLFAAAEGRAGVAHGSTEGKNATRSKGAPRRDGVARGEGAAREEGTARGDGVARGQGVARGDGVARGEGAAREGGTARGERAARGEGAARGEDAARREGAADGDGLVGGSGWLEAFHVREAGDPDAGVPARPCETCLTVLVELGFRPRADLAFTVEWRHGSDRIPAPGRFPHEVARVLAGGGWLGAPMPTSPALAAAEELLGRPAFPAARAALSEFGGVRCGRRGPGRRRAIRLLTFDPLPGARQAVTLAEFAAVIDTPVFPVAVEGGDALIVLDERGRAFARDQSGEWFLGATFDEAITALLAGDGPALRLHDDGTW